MPAKEMSDVVDMAQALETICVTRSEDDKEQRLVYEHACEVTAAVAELVRERDALANEAGRAIVLTTLAHDESSPPHPDERALCSAVRELLAQRDRLHSFHEDEETWRKNAERERDEALVNLRRMREMLRDALRHFDGIDCGEAGRGGA